MLKNSLALILCGALVSIGAQRAHAACTQSSRTITGESADGLAYILMNSSFAHRVRVGSRLVLTAHEISCSQTQRGVTETGLHDYDCGVPSHTSPLASKLFFDTLTGLGVFGDGYTSHIGVDATAISCDVDGSRANQNQNPTCVLTAYWASDCH